MLHGKAWFKRSMACLKETIPVSKPLLSLQEGDILVLSLLGCFTFNVTVEGSQLWAPISCQGICCEGGELARISGTATSLCLGIAMLELLWFIEHRVLPSLVARAWASKCSTSPLALGRVSLEEKFFWLPKIYTDSFQNDKFEYSSPFSNNNTDCEISTSNFCTCRQRRKEISFKIANIGRNLSHICYYIKIK